ncbi:PAS domain S-box protein [Synechococcus sp. RSCCF101]|uniref:PAS domain-containing protein n=1 Tax=Synechococcus sp. RSCCF101 TaxID=2511069 RepID=UPI00124942FB|nr:PAS domain-containing protein [Synechococcus sp. RSCCF101]QEY30932.1 PAS domain S-box protein [Synechococcus sp. RSCCF101]
MERRWTASAIAALRERERLPFVRADANGDVVEISPRFTEVYGWTEEELIGESLGRIMPPEFRELHHAGFARFRMTEVSRVLDHPLRLATFRVDGTSVISEHYIVAEQAGDTGVWSFAATLRPLEGEHAMPEDV